MAARPAPDPGAQPVAEPNVPQSATARVSGVVTNQRGAALADVKIQVTPNGADTGYTVTTDADGRYQLEVPPAQYQIRAEKPGFRASLGTIFLTRGTALRRDMQLSVGSVSESINVVSASDSVERAKTLMESGRYDEAKVALDQALVRLKVQTASGRTSAWRSSTASRQRRSCGSRPRRRPI